MGSRLVWRSPEQPVSVVYEDMSTNPTEMFKSIQFMSTPAPDSANLLNAFKARSSSMLVDTKTTNLQEYLQKMQHFENTHFEDIYLDQTR